MSWSIDITGTKAGASKKVAEQLDKQAASCGDKEEAKDVLFAKERILSLIEAMQLASDGYVDWNVVIVKANGLHSSGATGLMSATMQISVARSNVALDPKE